MRMSVSKQEGIDFMTLLFITKLLIEKDGTPESNAAIPYEIEFKKRKSKIEQVIKAKSEFSKAVNENAEVLP